MSRVLLMVMMCTVVASTGNTQIAPNAYGHVDLDGLPALLTGLVTLSFCLAHGLLYPGCFTSYKSFSHWISKAGMMTLLISTSLAWRLPPNSAIKNGMSLGPTEGDGEIRCSQESCVAKIDLAGRLQLKRGRSLGFVLKDSRTGSKTTGVLKVTESSTIVSYRADTILPDFNLMHYMTHSDDADDYNRWTNEMLDNDTLRTKMRTKDSRVMAIPTGKIGKHYPHIVRTETKSELGEKYKCGHWKADDFNIKQIYTVQVLEDTGLVQWVPIEGVALNVTICLELGARVCITETITSDSVITFEHPDFRLSVHNTAMPSFPHTPSFISRYTVKGQDALLTDWRILNRQVRGDFQWGSIGAVQTTCVWTNNSRCSVGSFEWNQVFNWDISSKTTCAEQVLIPKKQHGIITIIILSLIAGAVISGAITAGVAAGANCNSCTARYESAVAPDYNNGLMKEYAGIDTYLPNLDKDLPYAVPLLGVNSEGVESTNGTKYMNTIRIAYKDYESAHLDLTLAATGLSLDLPSEKGQISTFVVPKCIINLAGVSECDVMVTYTGITSLYHLYSLDGSTIILDNEIQLKHGINTLHIGVQVSSHGATHPQVCIGAPETQKCVHADSIEIIRNPDQITVVDREDEATIHSNQGWDFHGFWDELTSWWQKIIVIVMWVLAGILAIIIIVILVKTCRGLAMIATGASKVMAENPSEWATSYRVSTGDETVRVTVITTRNSNFNLQDALPEDKDAMLMMITPKQLRSPELRQLLPRCDQQLRVADTRERNLISRTDTSNKACYYQWGWLTGMRKSGPYDERIVDSGDCILQQISSLPQKYVYECPYYYKACKENIAKHSVGYTGGSYSAYLSEEEKETNSWVRALDMQSQLVERTFHYINMSQKGPERIITGNSNLNLRFTNVIPTVTKSAVSTCGVQRDFDVNKVKHLVSESDKIPISSEMTNFFWGGTKDTICKGSPLIGVFDGCTSDDDPYCFGLSKNVYLRKHMTKLREKPECPQNRYIADESTRNCRLSVMSTDMDYCNSTMFKQGSVIGRPRTCSAAGRPSLAIFNVESEKDATWDMWNHRPMCADEVKFHGNDRISRSISGRCQVFNHDCVPQTADMYGMNLVNLVGSKTAKMIQIRQAVGDECYYLDKDSLGNPVRTQLYGGCFTRRDHVMSNGTVMFTTFQSGQNVVVAQYKIQTKRPVREDFVSLQPITLFPQESCRGCSLVVSSITSGSSEAITKVVTDAWAVEEIEHILHLQGDVSRTTVLRNKNLITVVIECKRCEYSYGGKRIMIAASKTPSTECMIQGHEMDVFSNIDGVPMEMDCLCVQKDQAYCYGPKMHVHMYATCQSREYIGGVSVPMARVAYGCGDRDATIDIRGGIPYANGNMMASNDSWSSYETYHPGEQIKLRGKIKLANSPKEEYNMFLSSSESCEGLNWLKCMWRDYPYVLGFTIGLPLAFLIMILILWIARLVIRTKIKKDLARGIMGINNVADRIMKIPSKRPLNLF